MKMRLLAILWFVITQVNCNSQDITLWGLTSTGGTGQSGIIFKYDLANNTITDEHDFGSDTDGANPTGSLISLSNGLLYGVTRSGGVSGSGVIFSYNVTTGVETVLHAFGDSTDGIEPNGPLVAVGDTVLYGTTPFGGKHAYGTIFSYNISTGAYKDIYDINGDSIYSATQPMGPLIQANNGLLYGVNKYNGTYGDGGIFSYNIATGIENDIYSFNDTTGNQPEGGLIQANNGLLYGMTIFGGANSIGTLFTYNTTTGADSGIQSFSGNFGRPITTFVGSLFQANNNLLYGLTFEGGINNAGVIFNYSPANGLYLVQHNFGGTADGSGPVGSLIQASNGLLYGVTANNGTDNDGTLFSYDIATSTESVVHSFSGTTGANPSGALLEIDFPTSIPQLTNTIQVQISPNPSTGQFTIRLPNNQNNYPAEVYNVLGQKIQQLTLTNTQNALNLTNQPTGMYFVYVQTENGVVTGTVMVIR